MSKILQNVYQTNDMNCEFRFDVMKKKIHTYEIRN